jgi:hypothetical protein
MNKLIEDENRLKSGQYIVIRKALPEENIKKLENIAEGLRTIKSRPIYISEECKLGGDIVERYESAGLKYIFKKAEPFINKMIGGQWLILSNKVLLRRTWPISEVEARQLGHNASNLTWHQDSNNKHQNNPMVVLMVSLQNGAGINRPGLSILDKRTEKFEGIFGYEGNRVEEFEEEMRGNDGQLKIVNPQLHRGDLLIFDGLTFHRTYSRKEMTSHRDALLIRLIRPEDRKNFPAGNHCMVKLSR